MGRFLLRKGKHVRIKCAKCQEVIYECADVGVAFSGDRVLAEKFTPIRAEDPAPQDGDEMRCPRCGESYVRGVEDGVLLLLEDGSWWPHPPFGP